MKWDFHNYETNLRSSQDPSIGTAIASFAAGFYVFDRSRLLTSACEITQRFDNNHQRSERELDDLVTGGCLRGLNNTLLLTFPGVESAQSSTCNASGLEGDKRSTRTVRGCTAFR